ncbi:MAG: hypothetical protein NVSMB17_11710 [Candidatus Dormibacteria bacterium]
MATSKRSRASEAIRSAAWAGAASTDLTAAPPGEPPLSSQGTGSAPRRRSPRPSPPTRQSAGAIKSTRRSVRAPSRNGHKNGSAPTAGQEFYEAVVAAEDFRENPFSAFRVGEAIMDRLFSGTFEQRDPDLIREGLPISWLMATLYFRARVEGLDNIPDVGPALLVGNHSGGNYIPDSFILGMAFATYFGAERPWFALTHSAVMTMPILGRIMKSFGSIPASRENADEALRRGACVLVYPGGDIETYRPWWKRNEVSLAGRKGFIRTALKAEVPIVPVVNIGSHETGIFISDGQWLCKLLGWDKTFRIKATPIQVGLPWGIWVTDFLPRLLLPAKIEIRVLPEMHFSRTGPEAAADDAYVQECFDEVVRVMQEAHDEMASRRRWPIIG